MQQKSKKDLRAEIQFSDSSEHLYDTAVKNIKHLFDFLSLSNQNIPMADGSSTERQNIQNSNYQMMFSDPI
jgi:hypothetical protein